MKLNKKDVTMIIGCISGYSVAKAIGKGFKMTCGKAGLIEGLGRLAIKLSFGILAGSFTAMFIDGCVDRAEKAIKKYDLKKEKPDLESGFVTKEQFDKFIDETIDLGGLPDVKIEYLRYYRQYKELTADTSADEDDVTYNWPDFTKLIDEELNKINYTPSPIKGEEAELYYYDDYLETCYVIFICEGEKKRKDEQ